MFTPLDILYIVLAFCILWFTAAIFWLVWQVASIFKNVNNVVSETREKIEKIEIALTGIRDRFEHATSSMGGLVDGISRVVEFAMDRKEKKSEKKKAKVKRGEEGVKEE